MVGLSSTQLWGYHVPEALQIAARIGYSTVEVWAEHVWGMADDPSDVRREAEKLGLKLTVHSASWDLNLTARNVGIRQTSIGEVIRSIALAEAIGAHAITVHPGRASLHGKDLPWHWELQVEAFRRLAEEGAARGVRVHAELMEPIPREFFIEPGDANHLLKLVNHPNLGLTFDVAHVPVTRNPVDMLRSLDRVDEIHLSDSTATKLHVALGKGEIPLADVFRDLVRLNRPMVIEGYEAGLTDRLAVENKHMFDNLWAAAAVEADGPKV